MYVEIIKDLGKPPVRIEASQVVVYLDDGTPVSVSADYGNGLFLSNAGEEDFQKNLDSLGINQTVICDRLELPPAPAGATLTRG